MKISEVDQAINASSDGIAERLANLLDRHGAWDWSDGAEHAPCDRVAVVESTGGWWCVYRGTEPDQAEHYASSDEAREALRVVTEALA